MSLPSELVQILQPLAAKSSDEISAIMERAVAVAIDGTSIPEDLLLLGACQLLIWGIRKTLTPLETRTALEDADFLPPLTDIVESTLETHTSAIRARLAAVGPGFSQLWDVEWSLRYSPKTDKLDGKREYLYRVQLQTDSGTVPFTANLSEMMTLLASLKEAVSQCEGVEQGIYQTTES